MRQDERNNERSEERERDSQRRQFSDDRFDRTGRQAPRPTDVAADGAYGESGRYRAEERARQVSRRDRGHDDGWGDNRAGYDNPGRYGVRGSEHEGRGGYTQDRAEDGLGGYGQSWAEYGFQGNGWHGNPRDEPRSRTDASAPWGGESWPGYQVRDAAGEVAGGRLVNDRSTRGPHAGRGPKGYRRTDERISDDICEALTRHPEIDATDIEVRVENGEVTLAGTVDSRQAKWAAVIVAEDSSGVSNVINQLRVTGGEPR